MKEGTDFISSSIEAQAGTLRPVRKKYRGLGLAPLASCQARTAYAVIDV